MPETVHRLVTSVSGPFHIVADRSSPGTGRPRIWEVEDPHGCRWFAKQNPGPRLHQREASAYESGWAAALGPGRAPLLAAHDPTAQALVTTAVPGRPVHGQRLAAEQEREVYRQAGQLLARLNAAPVDRPVPELSTAGWETAVEKMLASARLYATPDDLVMLRDVTRDQPAALPPVVSHGDYMPRNWLWDPTEQVLRIIDFERTGIEPSAHRDLPRLHYRLLYDRPDLQAAFYTGRGRTPDAFERHACAAYGALDAMSALRYGLEKRDIESVDEAHTMLRHLRTEYTQHLAGRHRHGQGASRPGARAGERHG
ncbi:aminoglycoside phosphotransferase family protein [Streptomyces xanthochromogenes]|uniref:aminoglycoside phosphotransferase family protein n=1 Tax=Streptomyces xanthochromogenes TaxID=67384 RepID=UPI0034380D89